MAIVTMQGGNMPTLSAMLHLSTTLLPITVENIPWLHLKLGRTAHGSGISDVEMGGGAPARLVTDEAGCRDVNGALKPNLRVWSQSDRQPYRVWVNLAHCAQQHVQSTVRSTRGPSHRRWVTVMDDVGISHLHGK